jgi:hypothetical protein
MSTKEKGDLLEDILEQMCSNIRNAKITRNAKILGKKSNTERDVDILVEGSVGAFEVKIAVESKNYAEPVGIEKIESFKAKLEDIGVELGVMICPTGFTEPAQQRARFDGIQLFEVYDPKLGNSSLFIPLRYVEPAIKVFAFQVQHRVIGPFSMPQDVSRWRFHVGDRRLNSKQLITHAWNIGTLPQVAGTHLVNFNAMTISDVQQPECVQYCELTATVDVVENYYLSLLPASYFKNVGNGKENFNLPIRVFSSEVDMLKNGWKKFDSLEAMNKAAEIENQPSGVRSLLIRPGYSMDLDQFGDE